MCLFCGDEPIDRRTSVASVASSAVAITNSSQAKQAPAALKRALDDPNITHGPVSFKSGPHTVDGYLARPKHAEKANPVLILPGNWILEPYIPETAAMLAQGGFVGLVVNTFHLWPKVSSFDEAQKVSPDVLNGIQSTQITDELIMRDTKSAIEFLRALPFVKPGGVGITGFCFGARNALLFTAQSKDIAAVVPFYAPLTPVPGILRSERPKQPLDPDVVKMIRVPVQGHYGKLDRGISLEEVKKFARTLQAQGTVAEMHIYDAGHGFFAYNREGPYQPEATAAARSRMLAFFREHLAG